MQESHVVHAHARTHSRLCGPTIHTDKQNTFTLTALHLEDSILKAIVEEARAIVQLRKKDILDSQHHLLPP